MKTILALAVVAVAVLQIEASKYYGYSYKCKYLGPGHFADPHDCTAFIQCDAHGNAFHKYCPYGTVFNPYIEVCVHENKYSCPGKHGYKYKYNPCKYNHGALLPYKKNCHYFIHCSHGVAYVKACPAKLVWNDKRKRCDWYKPHYYGYCHYYGYKGYY